MKLTIRLEIECEVDGRLGKKVAVGEIYRSKIPSCILSEDEDGTDGWALLAESVKVISVKEHK